MAFELTGKIIEIYEIVKPTGNFQKREFVVENKVNNGGMEFIDYVKFQLIQDKCNLIDGFKVNDQVKVHFNIRGNRWEKEGKVSYFTNLTAWKIEGETIVKEPVAEAPFPGEEEIPPESSETELNDLPF